MNTRKLASGLRPLGLGLVCAAIGFSYALATASRGFDGADADSRAISTNATRPDTIFVTEADLGFIVVGSFFTRQINVVFGLKPHIFQFTQGNQDGFTITSSGRIQGQVKEARTYTFDVRVFDREISQRAKSKVKTYNITALDALQSPNALDIVNTSPLPTGVANEPYAYSFHPNGGLRPYEFFVVDDDIPLLPKGLILNADGLLFGKPIQPTAGVTFRIGVIDGGGTVVIKSFTLRILAGTVSSEFVGMRGKILLEFGKDGAKDSGTLSMILNKTDLFKSGVRKTADLENVFFEMNLAGVAIPPSKFNLFASGNEPDVGDDLYLFDKNGSLSYPNLRKGIVRDPSVTRTYAIKLNPQTGLLTVKFKDANLIKTIGANFFTFNIDPILPVSIAIGSPARNQIKSFNNELEPEQNAGPVTDPNDPNATPVVPVEDPLEVKNRSINYDRTDNIRFAFRRSINRNKGTASENTKRPPGGLFLTTKVAGDIRKNQIDPRKDSLFMQFSGLLSDVDGAPIPILADDKIQVFASDVNLAEFPASMLVREGTKIVFRNADPAIGLRTLILDTVKGTFILETNAMNPRNIFGVDFVEAGEPLTLPLTITIFNPLSVDPKFDGQTNVTVFRRGNKLRNK